MDLTPLIDQWGLPAVTVFLIVIIGVLYVRGQGKLAESNAELTTANAKTQQQMTRFAEKFESQLDAADARHDEDQKRLNTLQAEYDKLIAKSGQHSAQIGMLEAQIGELKSNLTAKDAEIAQLVKDKQVLADRVTQLQNEAAGREKYVEYLQGSLVAQVTALLAQQTPAAPPPEIVNELEVKDVPNGSSS